MFDTDDVLPGGFPCCTRVAGPWPWPAISRTAPLDRLSGNGGINFANGWLLRMNSKRSPQTLDFLLHLLCKHNVERDGDDVS